MATTNDAQDNEAMKMNIDITNIPVPAPDQAPPEKTKLAKHEKHLLVGLDILSKAAGTNKQSKHWISSVECMKSPRDLFYIVDELHTHSLPKARLTLYESSVYDMMRCMTILQNGLSLIVLDLQDQSDQLPEASIQSKVQSRDKRISNAVEALRKLVEDFTVYWTDIDKEHDKIAGTKALQEWEKADAKGQMAILSGLVKNLMQVKAQQAKDQVMTEFQAEEKDTDEDRVEEGMNIDSGADKTEEPCVRGYAENSFPTPERGHFEEGWNQATALVRSTIMKALRKHFEKMNKTIKALEDVATKKVE